MRIRYLIEICDETRKGLRREKGKYKLANRAEVIEAAEEALEARWSEAREDGPSDRRHRPDTPPVYSKGSLQTAERQAREISRAHGEAWIVVGRASGKRTWFVGTPRVFSGEEWEEMIESPKRGEGIRDVYLDGELDQEW
jgi:hypothetical protein